MQDFLFRGTMSELDPEIHKLNNLEAERQYRRLILIPSESTAPLVVREALSSAFHNIYAEGYPQENSRQMSEEEILSYEDRLGEYRRYSDPRYYKGVEYADTLEALARRRCAELFAANGVGPNDLFVNVQALSGAPANNAVYHALVQPGDTVMGMDLLHGGHLSHGSPVNRSGKYYNIVHYTVDPDSERIDYEEMAELAAQHKPKMIIGGFSSYPWVADWEAMRTIADSVGAILLADMAHVAGLVAAGVYPSPIGHAHVVTSTTHKTLNGPRGAIILTTDQKIARKIDRAVFPGEQGGPHVNVFAALALAFKIAKTDDFKDLQTQVIKNCVAMTARLESRGFRIPFGGTNTHLTNLDCKSIKGPTGTTLSGDMAARILDLAGIVVNRNTIPGDRSALNPSGVRLGTPWITQRGFKEKDSKAVADIIADVLQACIPYRDRSAKRLSQRAKVDFSILEEAKLRVRELAESAGIDFESSKHAYPHFYYIDDSPEQEGDWAALDVIGNRAAHLLNIALISDIDKLNEGESQSSAMRTPQREIQVLLSFLSPANYQLSMARKDFGLAAAWLRALSDGYVAIDSDDLQRKAPGPIMVRESETVAEAVKAKAKPAAKAFFYGLSQGTSSSLPDFNWTEKTEGSLKHTPLFDAHVEAGAKMVPFAGWEMPLSYSSVRAEHMAVREAAGLFDVSHMGVYQAEGPQAATFLDSLCANDIGSLKVGRSIYTHFLDPNAKVIDDLLVYRITEDRYLLVVNAANDDKDWAWLNAVREGKVSVDLQNPGGLAFGRGVNLLDLRDPKTGKAMLVDIALQGPKSLEILLALKSDETSKENLRKLRRYRLIEARLGKFDLIVSRTGYTGETFSFELFVHPDKALALWQALLKVGESLGLQACGLAARDSLRIEAGLPLYGQEMAGPLDLSPADAGFRTFVKSYKPWFIGRDGFLKLESERKREILRFRFPEKRTRPAHQGDPVVDTDGNEIGTVTSCSIDRFGTLTGQAHISKKFKKTGTEIFIYQGKASKGWRKAEGKPTRAQVLTRFPE